MNTLEFSESARNIILGNYRHYKGGEYKVLHIVRHSETLEELVVYQDKNNSELVWARPLEMFIGEEDYKGDRVKRFTYLSLN